MAIAGVPLTCHEHRPSQPYPWPLRRVFHGTSEYKGRLRPLGTEGGLIPSGRCHASCIAERRSYGLAPLGPAPQRCPRFAIGSRECRSRDTHGKTKVPSQPRGGFS